MTDNNQTTQEHNLLNPQLYPQINLIKQKSSQNSIKFQPKDFIIKNEKHLLEVYTLNSKDSLGEGGHASVLKLYELDSEGKKISTNKCVKKFEKRNLFFKNNEIQSLKSLDHPNIVKIYEYFDERDAYYIVMEEVEGRDLFEEITQRKQPFNEKETCQIVKQILLALKYTHKNGLIHRDIKLDNIMVSHHHHNTTTNSQKTNQSSQNLSRDQSQNKSEGLSEHEEDKNLNAPIIQIPQQVEDSKSIQTQSSSESDQTTVLQQQDQDQIEWKVKLIDWSFGLDTNNRKNKYQNTMCGSLQYQAPEYFNKNYNEKIDIWALGVVMYTMLCNKYPFNAKTKLETQQAIQKNHIVFGSEWDSITDEAKDIILKMLEKNPEKRPSAEELLDHVWFKIQKKHNQINQDIEIIKNNLRHLKQFKCENEFQKAILTFISINLVSSNEKAQLEKVFKALDTNEDGRLSKEEILNGFNQIWGDNYMNEDQIQMIFEQVDSDKSESIDYSEFVTATMQRNIFNEKSYLQKAFNLFDKDGDGYITNDEILQILGNSQDEENRSQLEDYIQQMIDQIDTSQDGKISFDEFCTMIQQFSNTEILMSQ